jgi:hypothetical protein
MDLASLIPCFVIGFLIGGCLGYAVKKSPPGELVFIPCPHCAEAIRFTAKICYHCRKHVSGPMAPL